MSRLFVALGATALMLPAVAAQAGSYGADRVVVRTDDIDLSTPAGQATLHVRVARAADAVCGQNLSRIHLSLIERAQECRADVVAKLEPRLDTLARRSAVAPVKIAMNR